MPADDSAPVALRGDSKQLLAESGLTAGWLIETLIERNPEFKKALGGGTVEQVVTNDISEGEGYASRVYKVTLTFTNANASEYAVIMKVPTSAKLGKLQEDLSEQMKDAVTDGMKEFWESGDVNHAHNVECAFYDAINGVEGFTLPKVWFTRRTNKDAPGVILMEDFGAVGCKTGFMQAMTAQQLRNITRHFAALHAYHICADESQRKRIEAVPAKCTFHTDNNESIFEGLVAGIAEAREGPLAELVQKLKPATSSKFMEYVLFGRPKELEPCDLLISMWETLSVRITFYLYLHSFPLWHLAIAVERAWATLRASGYERTSSLYGSLCAVCIWVISVGYIAFLVALATSDPEFLPVSSYVSFTTSRTAPLLFYGHFVLLGFELLSAIVDVALLLVNRRKLKNVVPEYSLSRSYQINENIVVTLYLALPLNICNMVLYSAFVALSSWIRSRRTSMDEHDFHIAYEWAHVLMLLQVTISLLVVLRFGSRVMPKAVVVSPREHADVYFQHFRQPIGAERAVLLQQH